MSLTPELISIRDKVEGFAREAGLDFFDVSFEVLDWNQINAVAAYGGFPNRYPHWRFGMEYEQISKSYAYGLSKIYEMVINNNPSYAYLLHSNPLVDQKLVMAHVYGHVDFFKNNVYFAGTNRKMIDQMGDHRTKVMRLINKHGIEKIEDFIDVCLSIENLIDRRQIGYFIPRSKRMEEEDFAEEATTVKKLKSRDYMDSYVNPKAFIESEQKKIDDMEKKGRRFPEYAERDVLLFLLDYAPLEHWEREILHIIREEAYYFAPQGMTKIMNEGWAAYHHTKIMTTRALTDDEVIDYADHHSGTVSPSPGRLNPYKLGMELFRDIEERYNNGRYGPDYENCDDMVAKKNWDKKLNQGYEKIFEVRKLYNDVTFLDAFLTEEFCHRHKMFVYGFNPATRQYEITDRSFKEVKGKLLMNLTNMGQPLIEVVDGNAFNRAELTVKHVHDGVDLKSDWLGETLKNLHRVWKRPVYLETVMDGVPKVYSFDGKEHKEETKSAEV